MKKIIAFLLLAVFFNTDAISQLTGDTSTGVRLSYFNASKQNNEVRLNWQVACRISYARFEVQRSANGIDFTTINSFQADYLRCQQPFDYTDPTATGQVFYRIKVGDIDGRFSTEKVIKITGKEITRAEIKVISPVTGSFLQLTVEAKSKEKIALQILNMSGSLLQSLTINPGKGINQIEMPLTNLQAGEYILSYRTEGEKKSVKFIKSN